MVDVASPEPVRMLRVIAEVTRIVPPGPVSSPGPLQESGRRVRLREGDVITETERLGTCLKMEEGPRAKERGSL